MDDLITLVYFNTQSKEVHFNLYIPKALLKVLNKPGAIYIDDANIKYKVKYYDDANKVAFALDIDNETYWRELQRYTEK